MAPEADAMVVAEHLTRKHILLADDEPGDAKLIEYVLKQIDMPTRLHVVEDGVEAIQFLRKAGRFTDAPRPHLILLDLNMPKKNGYEVLSEIKTDPEFVNIPVVVMTTSSEPSIHRKAYDLLANSVATKPDNVERLQEMMQTMMDYWFSGITKLPSEPDIDVVY